MSLRKKMAWKSRFALPLGRDESFNNAKAQPVCGAAADLQFDSSVSGAEIGALLDANQESC